MKNSLRWPLMENNVTEEDRRAVVEFLGRDPRLTQSEKVRAFEEAWSEWLGVRYSVFVNSGSSANLISLAVLRELAGTGEVLVPVLTWVSDVASILQCGFKPVFADIDPVTLGLDEREVRKKISPDTRAVFLTHILGYNALTDGLLRTLGDKKITLLEDACESHGAVFRGRRVGTFGLASNFSFYYGHHMSTIEGGMISTNDEKFYELARMFRSHGLVRETVSEGMKREYQERHPDLDPEFIFAFPAYNMRGTEIQAVIGLSHLKRLSSEVAIRSENLKLFLGGLDPSKYRTDFAVEGSSNYALTLVLKQSAKHLSSKVEKTLREAGVEFRRGLSGGGNQLRQPYLRKLFGEEYRNYPQAEHIHFYGYYIGNYPSLDRAKIGKLCGLLNGIN
jgi:CDP-6-deoxy-D-xylo-4-hexulose-3-dehydrase